MTNVETIDILADITWKGCHYTSVFKNWYFAFLTDVFWTE